MEENELDTNTVQENNKKVFKRGRIIGVVGSLLTFWVAWYWFVLRDPPDGPNAIVGTIAVVPITSVILVAVVALINLGIYKITISPLNERNIEISGAKKIIIYAIEVVFALTPVLALLYLESTVQ